MVVRGMNRSGVVGIIFIGLFALLSGLVAGTLWGPKVVQKAAGDQNYVNPTNWPEGSR
jgi:hypothetical protein